VRDHEALLSMTLDGLGVALLPAWMAHEHVQSGRLVPLLPDCRGPSVDFSVVFLPHRSMAPNLRAFVDFLKERFKNNCPWEYQTNSEVRASGLSDSGHTPASPQTTTLA